VVRLNKIPPVHRKLNGPPVKRPKRDFDLAKTIEDPVNLCDPKPGSVRQSFGGCPLICCLCGKNSSTSRWKIGKTLSQIKTNHKRRRRSHRRTRKENQTKSKSNRFL